MQEFAEAITAGIRETDILTWIAIGTAVLYVVLALKENIWCWAFGIVSSALWISVYFHEELWYESLLNVFYVILGVYGWIQWAKEKKNADDSSVKPEIVIGTIPSRVLLICVSTAVVAGIVLGLISSSISKSQFAYSDALLTTFSVVATWMTAKKYIENWLFWLLINACSAGLYILKGPSMYLPAVLYIFYTFMSAAGYYSWKKSLKA